MYIPIIIYNVYASNCLFMQQRWDFFCLLAKVIPFLGQSSLSVGLTKRPVDLVKMAELDC